MSRPPSLTIACLRKVQSLRHIASNATSMVAGTVVITNALRILSTVVLTRLLSPADFGLIAILTSVTFALAMITDVGAYNFILKHESRTDSRFLDQVWTLRVVRSLIVSIVIVAISWPISIALDQPQLQLALCFWAITFFVDGLSSLSFATAIIDRRLARLSAFEVVSAVIQLAVAIVVCYQYPNFWGLIGAGIVSSMIKSMLSWSMFPGSARKVKFSKSRAGELWHFSKYIAASSTLTVVITQLDKLIFARLMPLTAFGFYAIANNLANAPTAFAGPYAQKVLYPLIAMASQNGVSDVRNVFYRTRRLPLLLFSFGIGALIGSADLIVDLLYDDRYGDVATYFQILAVGPLFALSTATSSEALIATGHMRWMLASNVSRVTWLVLGACLTFVLGNPLVLVVTVATMEFAAALVFWSALYKFGLLSFKEELLTPAAAIGGFLASFPIVVLISGLLPVVS